MANLTRFDPFNEMISLRQAMDRLFEDSFVSPLTWRSVEGDSTLAPALDVHQTADEIVVSASLAGVKPEDVQITLTGQTLQIRGEFKADEEVKRDPGSACRSGLTKAEAEELLDWLEANGYSHRELGYENGQGFVVRWQARPAGGWGPERGSLLQALRRAVAKLLPGGEPAPVQSPGGEREG